jgi:adenylosuccinate lyase
MHATDSSLFKDLFGTEEMRVIFSDESLVQKWLDVESALARVEARLGIIPQPVADEISRKAFVQNTNIQEIKKGIDQTGHPIVPLIRVLATACDGNAGEYVHWGATTQDIMDTGMVLQLRDAYEVIHRDLRKILEILVNLARTYKLTPMAGRTHGQHALPITFGYKVAVWIGEVSRNLQRLSECRKRLLVGQFAGAVGTLASFSKLGLEVQEGLMKELGLEVPEVTWHASRDSFAEFMSTLSLICTTQAKIANEIVVLQRTEINELQEPFPKGFVGSSTMPHKRNPSVCEGIVAMSKIIRSNVLLSHEAMITEHERDMRPWMTEWAYVPEVCTMAGAVLQQSKYVLGNLVVKTGNMQKNLNLTDGLIMSEAIMLRLADNIGKQTAHHLVYELAMQAFEQNLPFNACLRDNPVVRKYLTVEDIESILEPESYVGLSADIVDRITTRVEREWSLGRST